MRQESFVAGAGRRPRGAGGLGTLFMALAAAFVSTHAPCASLYVLNERSESISVVDLTMGAVVATIDLSDPDGDMLPDPPADLALSTVPGRVGSHAFVTQGRFLRVVDLRARAVTRTHDVAALLGTGGLTLSGCDAAPPRLHVDPANGSPALRSYLHLAATSSTGEARFVVFDQERLFLTAPGVPAGQGSLGANARGIGVKALEEPFGAKFQRAWYQTSSLAGTSSALHSVLVHSGQTLGSPWIASTRRVVPVPAAPTTPIRMGAPSGGGELPVLPTAATGSLTHLDTGDVCPLGGDLVAVSTTGPGLSSYTILAARKDTDELLVVDGKTCSAESFPTGGSPVDVTTLGPLDWTEAFTANRDGDSVSWLRPDRSVQTIVIGSGGSQCQACPTALVVARPPACAPTNLRLDVRDADGDGTRDDLHLEWTAPGCAAATQFVVSCTCVDDSPTCPCACDCEQPFPPPACHCPGLPVVAALGPGDFQIEPDTPIQENPWKILGVTGATSFNASDIGDDSDGIFLQVTAGPLE